MPKSGLYEGWISHRRRMPVEHEFRYRIFLAYLDLDELPDLFRGRWLWGYERRRPATFRRVDHLGDPDVPLADAVRDLVRRRTGRPVDGPIRLLTHLRYFGYCFNPVSFYYCFDDEDRSVECIVAEVHNTPWNERYAYVLDTRDGQRRSKGHRFRLAKDFHVSPFLPMDHEYDWLVGTPGPRLTTHMKNVRDDRVVFDATMALTRREIETASLTRMLARYPLMTGRVTVAIYAQALALWWKRAPFFEHPKNPWGQRRTP